MVRREIRSFELVKGEERYPCSIPCSVYSVLSEKIPDVDSVIGQVSFETEIIADEASMSAKYIYLRLRGINCSADIYIGENKIGEVDGKTSVYNFDVRDYLIIGSNILSVRFNSKNSEEILFAAITTPIEIIRFNCAIVDKVLLTQSHSDEGVTLNIKINLIGDSKSVRAVATLISATGQIYYAGLTKGVGSIIVRDPLFWCPQGMGVQNLYKFTVNLYGDNDIEDTEEMRIGLRTVSSDGKGGIVVNGNPFIPMGATYYVEKNLDPASVDKKAETLVFAAADSSFNCLVVPHDSARPGDRFYDLCDRCGILVIEEYDGISDEDMKALQHSRHHASLGVIDVIGEDNGVSEKFEKNLPGLLFEFDKESKNYISAPALPSMKTICEEVSETERSLFSKSIESIAEPGAIRDMLLSVAEKYPYPSDLSAFAYASALAAVNRVGDYVRDVRMSMKGRAVFNRLGDFKMKVSPSAIDVKSRWKPLQYYASRHFAPVALYASYENGRISFSASNLRKIDLIGTLEYRVADSSNRTVFMASEPCEISGFSSKVISNVDLSDYINGHESEYYLEYFLKEDTLVHSKKTLLFVPEKHFEFKKPKIKAVITGQERSFSITISSDVFIKDLEVGFDGVDVQLSDNYVDLTSEAPVKLTFKVLGGIETTYHLKDALEIRSVYNLK